MIPTQENDHPPGVGRAGAHPAREPAARKSLVREAPIGHVRFNVRPRRRIPFGMLVLAHGGSPFLVVSVAVGST